MPSGYVRIRVDGQTYSVDEPPQIDRRRKHEVEVVIDRVTIRPDARSRHRRQRRERAGAGPRRAARGLSATACPKAQWPVETHSQHFVCDRCGRSFEPLSPHNFSFNSALGWCPACEGLGTQTGTNPAALLRDPKLTLAGGRRGPLAERRRDRFSRAMLEAFSRDTGMPLDVPFEELAAGTAA